ncbi:hypothetical protein F5883DRAFT_714577 [Diaporthe sp. PMI_573]|nr:hypothetical protein F5883DRAFT_714577 [Diaporthaceae sp. PMI_573]
MGLRLRATPGYLPPELALCILAHADYRPRITSSRAEVVDYRWEARPWYLTTPMLPPDFGRASSLTLQVRSADHMDWETFAAGCDGAYEGCHTWFEMCILRPLREDTAAAAPVCGGGGVRHWQEQGPEVRMSRTFRGGGDADQDFRRWDRWLVVNHNGRETWVVHHGNRMFPDWKNCRVDLSADIPTDIGDPRAVRDGEGFLSALMPGDKIVLWAAAEEPAWAITVAEAVIEVVYDVWV